MQMQVHVRMQLHATANACKCDAVRCRSSFPSGVQPVSRLYSFVLLKTLHSSHPNMAIYRAPTAAVDVDVDLFNINQLYNVSPDIEFVSPLNSAVVTSESECPEPWENSSGGRGLQARASQHSQ